MGEAAMETRLSVGCSLRGTEGTGRTAAEMFVAVGVDWVVSRGERVMITVYSVGQHQLK